MSAIPSKYYDAIMQDYKKATIRQCVDGLISEASAKYKISIALNQNERTPTQAQQFHVCHMFLYNKFHHLTPKNVEKGQRTIAWTAMSDASKEWDLIPNRGDFLVTATDEATKTEMVDGQRVWAKGSEPDLVRSTARMKLFLRKHNVTSMAAPGKNGCGYPCECGGLASAHVRGAACDLSGLQALGLALAKAPENKLTLDEFLAQYDLYRPMANLPGDRKEEWHVEKLPHHKPRPKADSVTSGAGHPHAQTAGKAGLSHPGSTSISDPRLQNAILRGEQLRNSRIA